ncbi:MAG: hypothetical protein HYU52_14940 [Acidobacteria bacterium]|nr:hypothetical protein [Acidobacteriota bacterium]
MRITSETRTQIEGSIERARKEAAARVAAIEGKIRGKVDSLRTEIDVNRVAAENAPQLVAAGVAAGIVLGYSLPKPLRLVLEVAAVAGLATVIARKIAERAGCADDELESVDDKLQSSQ